MLTLTYFPLLIPKRLEWVMLSRNASSLVVCAAKGPRPRYPRVWKTKPRIGTISKAAKFVQCIKGLSNVKEEVYGALDSFVAWELEFPLITVKKALKTLENEGEWKRIIQVIKWMLSKGQGRTMGSYFMLLNALAEDDRLDEAEELWNKLLMQTLESLPRIFFCKMISIYYRRSMHDKMFEVFADMEELGVKPDISTVKMVGKVFQQLDMVEKYEKLNKKYPPPKWEYRYYKGKRVRIQVKNLNAHDGFNEYEKHEGNNHDSDVEELETAEQDSDIDGLEERETDEQDSDIDGLEERETDEQDSDIDGLEELQTDEQDSDIDGLEELETDEQDSDIDGSNCFHSVELQQDNEPPSGAEDEEGEDKLQKYDVLYHQTRPNSDVHYEHDESKT